jgi:hypothetical protein
MVAVYGTLCAIPVTVTCVIIMIIICDIVHRQKPFQTRFLETEFDPVIR